MVPSLLGEQQDLRADLLRQQLELAHLREALRHVEHAQTLTTTGVPQGLIARVIDRSRLPTQRTIIIDRGTRDGVVLNSVVLDIAGLAGRVLESYQTTSVVLLLTDPQSRVAGMVERTRETGLLVGQARGVCKLVYLDEHADVEVGDRIVTAGLGGSVPKGLGLGTVSQVFRDAERGTAWVVVQPVANLGRLEEVLCVPPGGRKLVR